MKHMVFYLIMLLSISCSNRQKELSYQEPVFPIEKHIPAQILTDTALIAYPYDLNVDDSYLYLLSLVDGNWLHIYNKHTGEWVCSGIRHGQGPDEIATGTILFLERETNSLYIYDSSQSKLLGFSFDKEKKSLSCVSHKSFVEYGGVARTAWPLTDEHYLVNGQEKGSIGQLQRFQLYNQETLVAKYNTTPTADRNNDIAFISASQSLSPDKSKLVVGTLWGGILETFRIDKRIENISTRYFLPINIQFIKGTIQPTDQTMYGFTSVQALNDRIWGIWIGDKDPNHNSSIVCFDWDGKEIAQYHTDNILLKIAQSPEEPNRVYAVVASPEKGFYLVYFDV